MSRFWTESLFLLPPQFWRIRHIRNRLVGEEGKKETGRKYVPAKRRIFSFSPLPTQVAGAISLAVLSFWRKYVLKVSTTQIRFVTISNSLIAGCVRGFFFFFFLLHLSFPWLLASLFFLSSDPIWCQSRKKEAPRVGIAGAIVSRLTPMLSLLLLLLQDFCHHHHHFSLERVWHEARICAGATIQGDIVEIFFRVGVGVVGGERKDFHLLSKCNSFQWTKISLAIEAHCRLHFASTV